MDTVHHGLSTQMAASDQASRIHLSAVQQRIETRHDESEVLLTGISNKQDSNAESLENTRNEISTLTSAVSDLTETVNTAKKMLQELTEKERKERTDSPKALFGQTSSIDATSAHAPAPAPVTVIDTCSVDTPANSSRSVATTAVESSASSVSTTAAVSFSLSRRSSSGCPSKSEVEQMKKENEELKVDNKSKEEQLYALKRPNDSIYCTPGKKAKQQRRAVDHEQKHKERMFEGRLTRSQAAAQKMGSDVVPPPKRRGV